MNSDELHVPDRPPSGCAEPAVSVTARCLGVALALWCGMTGLVALAVGAPVGGAILLAGAAVVVRGAVELNRREDRHLLVWGPAVLVVGVAVLVVQDPGGEAGVMAVGVLAASAVVVRCALSPATTTWLAGSRSTR